MAYHLGTTDFSLQLERIREAEVDAVVHWGNATESARILNQMRAMELEQPYFCSDRSVSAEFVRIAAENAEGVWAGYPWNPERRDPKLEAFRYTFQNRFGVEPDTYAAHAFDGMNMLIWAVQVAGLNRAKIRDVLAYRVKPWPGVTGETAFSAALDDVGVVTLARFESGQWEFYTREELAVPRGKIPPRDRVSRAAAESTED
jgi:ABC-type branched-subunit amino acid transport system substrate-binding protein